MNTLTTYQDLVSNLQSNSVSNPEELADIILKIGNHFNIQAPPPIVRITESFGFSVYLQPNMNPNESANIYIGGTTANYYHSNKVIIVSNKEEYFHQRFIVAHELGNYLMNISVIQNTSIILKSCSLNPITTINKMTHKQTNLL